MPGPVSDSYDPEWGTGSNAHDIRSVVRRMYDKVSHVALADRDPIDIRNLAYAESAMTDKIPVTLTEWEWRIIRFSLERAEESI